MCHTYCILAASEAIRRFLRTHTHINLYIHMGRYVARTTARMLSAQFTNLLTPSSSRRLAAFLFVAQVDHVIDSNGVRLKIRDYIASVEIRSTSSTSIMADTQDSLSSFKSVNFKRFDVTPTPFNIILFLNFFSGGLQFISDYCNIIFSCVFTCIFYRISRIFSS